VVFAKARDDLENKTPITRIHECTCHNVDAAWKPSCHYEVVGLDRGREWDSAV
jgi:hypothetical protein